MITVIYIWEIHTHQLLKAIWRMAMDRRSLKRDSSVAFFKLLGTGSGDTFTPGDANPRVWALLVTLDPKNANNQNKLKELDSSKVVTAWRKFAHNEVRLIASPISSHGHWSKQQPFLVTKQEWDGKILAITRARIAWRQNLKFWRAVPPVIESLRKSPGLELAIGIGEAPVGLQGTLSIWRDSESLREFAYKSAAHTAVIKRTELAQWYSEELFARFALLEIRGLLTQP
jgi:hypothetical protein